MLNAMNLKSPIFFVLLSFVAGVLNFIDTLLRLIYPFIVPNRAYPLGLYLKPIFFLLQAVSLILFIWRVRFSQKPLLSGGSVSRFFSANLVLIVVVILLYVDFQVAAIARFTAANVYLQLAFYLAYLIALSGTCFWLLVRLQDNRRKRYSIVFGLIGVAFFAAFLDPMLFWLQNSINIVLPSEVAVFATYAPAVLMFLAGMLGLGLIFLGGQGKNDFSASRWSLVLLIPAFVLPLLWNGYKDGLINFIVRDVFYWSLGYSGYEWYFVSFYFMSVVAYFLVWNMLSKRSDHSVAHSLIVLGVASFPWNGVTPLRLGYSSIPGNVVSLCSIITGMLLLQKEEEEAK